MIGLSFVEMKDYAHVKKLKSLNLDKTESVASGKERCVRKANAAKETGGGILLGGIKKLGLKPQWRNKIRRQELKYESN